MKKIISISLVLLIIFISVPDVSFAKENESYPLIVVPGYSASYLYTEEEDGSLRQLWGSFEGLNIAEVLLANIAKLGVGLGGAILNRPEFLADTLSVGINKLLGDLAYNPDGTPVVNTVTYPNDPAITNYKYLIDEKGSMHTAEIEIMSDIADYYGDKGFENIFSFQTDFRLNIVDAIENLRNYVDAVLEYTGAEKVDIFAVSYGGQVTASYLNVYGSENKVHNAVLTVPAIGGAALAYDIMSENVQFDEETLFYFLENGMMLEEDINWLMKAHSLGFLDDLLNLVIKGGVKDLIGFWGSIWDFIPAEHYEELKGLYLNSAESGSLIEKSDKFHNEILPVMTDKLQECVDNGTNIYIVSGYGNPSVTGMQEQSDGIIHLNAATGAECAPYGLRFSDGFKGKFLSCKNDSHNHISPDMTVDASTGYLPEQTWYIGGLFHGMTWKDDYTKSLCKKLLFSEDLLCVHSDTEYPQFRYSTNLCFAVDFSFDDIAYGTVSDESKSLTITNISDKYKIKLISVAAFGEEISFELPCCTVLNPSESITINIESDLNDISYKTVDVCVNFASIGNITMQGERTLTFMLDNGVSPDYDEDMPYTDALQPTFFDKCLDDLIESFLIKTGLLDYLKMIFNCFYSIFLIRFI